MHSESSTPIYTNDFPNPVPSDCLLHIMSFLTPNDYKTWDRVCKQWNNCLGEAHFKQLAKKELKIKSFVPKTSWKKFYLCTPVGKNLIKNSQLEIPPKTDKPYTSGYMTHAPIKNLPHWNLVESMI